MREPVGNQNGKQYWRSLDELANTPEFQRMLHREFPALASEMTDGVTRRKFLWLMAASLGLAGVQGCRRPVERIFPAAAVSQPIIAGEPLYYATVMGLGGEAVGLLVKSSDGRPTKVEGNPLHPASLGAVHSYAQAAVLELYDPDRSRFVVNAGRRATWKDFLSFADSHFGRLRQAKGAGLRVLSETLLSPSLAALRDFFLKAFPEAKWHVYDAVSQENVEQGSRIAFGQVLHMHYVYDKADVILSLDGDFLGVDPRRTASIRQFAHRRRVAGEKDTMNRLYVVETHYSMTGAAADHRLRLPQQQIPSFLKALAAELLESLEPSGGHDAETLVRHRPAPTADSKGASDVMRWSRAVAKDLRNHRGKSIIVAGPRQPAVVHALAHLLNQKLGNVGATVRYTHSVEDQPASGMESIKDLTTAMDRGQVQTLLLLGGNPVYDAPADLDFEEKLRRVPTTIHLGTYNDETGSRCQWHIHAAHFLESWGDARALDGTAAIQQPLIEPLYDGKTAAEVLAAVSAYPQTRAYDIVQGYWRRWATGTLGDEAFEKFWKRTLHDGVLAGTAFPTVEPTLRMAEMTSRLAQQRSRALPSAPLAIDNLELAFTADVTVFDGRFANNGWLQELPDPMTKLTWDNAALLSPATAKALGIVNEDLLVLKYEGRELTMPAWIQPGHADYSVTVTLGYGRTQSGRVGNGAGQNAYRLRTSRGMNSGVGLVLRKTGKKYPLACTQQHSSMEGREIVHEATLAEYKASPDLFDAKTHPPLVSITTPHRYDKGPQWGMAIDLNVCVGCNACVVACQAENNIPIVGKEQVRNGREMHWIRMDRYFDGDENDPHIVQQPVACQHCENAPCESVCPVAATVHSPDGLNAMAYNRCVGTRYCANNCPYKVRRFNFLDYHKNLSEVEKMAFNPDVTVRMRGVMEKCTYCVQRIESVRIRANADGHREIRDGEIVTACAQGCPAEAIVFGDINDPNSRVSQLKRQNRDYELLGELNVKPRTSYLAKLRNPNPELD